MQDPAVFVDFVRNIFGITTQVTIDTITNFVGSFGDFLVVNDEYIDTFSKDTHSANHARAAAQRILIINNITQGIKSMLFKLKDNKFWNDLPDEISQRGIKLI